MEQWIINIKKKYNINLKINPNMKLTDYLIKNNLPSLAKLIEI